MGSQDSPWRQGVGGFLTPRTPQSTLSWAVSAKKTFHQGSAVILQS